MNRHVNAIAGRLSLRHPQRRKKARHENKLVRPVDIIEIDIDDAVTIQKQGFAAHGALAKNEAPAAKDSGVPISMKGLCWQKAPRRPLV